MVGWGAPSWAMDLGGWGEPALLSVAAVKLFALLCALLSLVSVASAAAEVWWKKRPGSLTPARAGFVAKARFTALIFGTAAFTLLLVILGIRIVYVAVNLITVFPVAGAWDYGFDADGLWSLGCLFVACTIAGVSTGDKQLYTCQFLIAVAIVTWSSLLWPVFRMTSPGGLQGSGATLALTAGLALLLAVAAMINWWVVRRWCRPASPPDRAEAAEERLSWPGFHTGFTAVALVVLVLTFYQLAVPVGIAGVGFRVCALMGFGSASAAAWACFLLLSRSWSPNLADTAVGLTAPAVCCLAVAVVPAFPQSLAERYPVVLNAMIVGLAFATASCTWLATSRWRMAGEGADSLATERLTPHARRGALLSAALAVTLGGLMAVWPRLSSIAISDNSIGRISAGFGGNLILLLAVLWSARRLEGPAFQLLTLLTLASAAGFMMMRMLPYTPQFG